MLWDCWYEKWRMHDIFAEWYGIVPIFLVFTLYLLTFYFIATTPWFPSNTNYSIFSFFTNTKSVFYSVKIGEVGIREFPRVNPPVLYNTTVFFFKNNLGIRSNNRYSTALIKIWTVFSFFTKYEQFSISLYKPT